MKLVAWLASSSLLLACGGATAGVDLINAQPDPTDPVVDAGGNPPPTDPDAGFACPAIAFACDPGDVQVGGPNDCKDLACYSRGSDIPGCTSQIWCAKNHDRCDAVPTCESNETAFNGGCPPGPVGSTCRKVTVCESTIYCYGYEKPPPPPQK